MSLRDRLARYWRGYQPELLEALEVEVGPLGERYEQLIQGFEFVRVERLLWSGPVVGRPAKDRVALAQAFLAKAVFKLATTRDLIERLKSDDNLRRLCGWPSACAVPSEATFSRAFAEFAETALPGRLHEALIIGALGDHLVGHISRDATAIEAREKPVLKAPEAAKPKPGRGRQRKGEPRPREPGRLQRQRSMATLIPTRNTGNANESLPAVVRSLRRPKLPRADNDLASNCPEFRKFLLLHSPPRGAGPSAHSGRFGLLHPGGLKG